MLSYTLAQISDCHIDPTGAMGVDSVKISQKLLQKITHYPINSLIITGDLVHNANDASYLCLAQLLKQYQHKTQTNIHLIAGNHDDEKLLKQHLHQYINNDLVLGNWQVISLNSVVKDQVYGFITAQELARVKILLQQNINRFIIISLHHPIVSMQSSWDDTLSVNNPEVLFDLLKSFSHIKAIIWGHSHEYKTFEKNGIKLYSCPSAVKQFEQTKPYDGACILFELLDNGSINHQLLYI